MPATGDLFTTIHKGLRAMIYSLSGRLQTNDFADLAATRTLVVDLENNFEIARTAGCTLCILAHHAEDEETVIFGEAGQHAGGLVMSLIEDHHELTRRELALGKEGHDLLALGSEAARVQAGVRLNQNANGLFAAYIAHMNREETDLVPLMRDHFTDAQMAAMRGTIMGRLPPDRTMAILGWMLPALNVSELSNLLTEIRPGAPPPVFKAMTDLCAARVEPARWAEVKVRVGI